MNALRVTLREVGRTLALSATSLLLGGITLALVHGCVALLKLTL